MSSKPTSSHYLNLKIVNWEFINNIRTKDLRETKDPKTINKIINNFLQSSALFTDPSFCPPDMVNHYFQVLNIAVKDIVDQNNRYQQIIEEKDNEIAQLKGEKKKKKNIPPKYALPPILFQCTFCSKLFKTRKFLADHMRRRHSNLIGVIPVPVEEAPNPINSPPPPRIEHVVKTVHNTPEMSQDLGPFKAEINAMLDHFDTLLKTEHINVRTEFIEQFRRVDTLIRDTLKKIHNERNPSSPKSSNQGNEPSTSNHTTHETHTSSIQNANELPHTNQSSNQTNAPRNESGPPAGSGTYYYSTTDAESDSNNHNSLSSPSSDHKVTVTIAPEYDPYYYSDYYYSESYYS